MKNIVENIAIMLVVIFSMTIIVLIVQYNLIEDKKTEHVNTMTQVVKQMSQEQKNTDYIKNIEAHKEVNIKIDPKKESHFNKVRVNQEITIKNKENTIGDALDKLLN